MSCQAKVSSWIQTVSSGNWVILLSAVEKQLIIDDEIHYSAFQNNGNQGLGIAGNVYQRHAHNTAILLSSSYEDLRCACIHFTCQI